MKVIKKIAYIIICIIASLIIYSTIVKAATTVTVTADTLNLREKASTSSNIVAMLSQGVECELIEESGDWYKVKYKTYTGYVSKEYVKKNEDADNSNTNQITTDNNTTDNSSDDTVNSTTNNTEIDNTKVPDNDDEREDVANQTTGKISNKADVKIVPLIYSSKIDELDKNTTVTIFTEMNGWSYIGTDTVTGWIRSNIITNKKTVSSGSSQVSNVSKNTTNSQAEENNTNTVESNTTTSNTEKTMYINEASVNVRKEASTTSDIMMVLELNTKLTVIGESGDWYKVKTSEGNGYVLKTLLSTKQVTTSRGGSLTNHTVATSVSANNSSTTTATNIAPSSTTTSNKTSATTTKTTQTSTSTNSSVATASTSTKGQEVVAYAKQFLGVPYVYGGASKSGFDCSGFTMYVYKHFGISMAHGAKSQSKLGKEVKTDKTSASSLKKNLQAGDLVFFLDYETMDEIGHCGIYIGDGKFIHASSGSGYCVKINSLLPGEYYNTRYCAARRVL